LRSFIPFGQEIVFGVLLASQLSLQTTEKKGTRYKRAPALSLFLEYLGELGNEQLSIDN
jgi:hypothetical protein